MNKNYHNSGFLWFISIPVLSIDFGLHPQNVGVGIIIPDAKLHVVELTLVHSSRLEFAITGNSIFNGQAVGANDDFTGNENVATDDDGKEDEPTC